MSGSPAFKVYNAQGDYRAAFKDPSEAAALIAALGPGATIRYRHTRILWTEGSEADTADNSYDAVAETVFSRLEGRQP